MLVHRDQDARVVPRPFAGMVSVCADHPARGSEHSGVQRRTAGSHEPPAAITDADVDREAAASGRLAVVAEARHLLLGRRQCGTDRMVDRDLHEQLTLAAVAQLESGGAEREFPAGVRVLDNWRSDEHAAVLFWADRELDVWGSGEAVLHHVDLELVDGIWHGPGGGGAGTFSAAEILGDLVAACTASVAAPLIRCGLHERSPARRWR